MVTTVTTLPPVPSRNDAPDLFADRADAFLGSLPTFVQELNSLGAEVEGAGSDAAAQVALAEAQVTLATTQAGIATTQAGLALTRAGDANTSAVASSISASESLAAANDSEAALASFELKYLGSKTADPLTDNSGGALQEGQFYWHSNANELRFYNGTTWTTANLIAANYLVKTGDTMTGVLNLPANGLNVNSGQLITASAGGVGINGSPTSADKLLITQGSDFTIGTNNAIRIQGLGYNAALALDSTRLTFGHNSTLRSIVFMLGDGSGGYTERMRIAPNGNVGIGVEPTVRFHVQGGRSAFHANSEPYSLQVNYNTVANGYFLGGLSDGSLVVSTAGGAEKLRVDTSGNLGINTTPSSKLDLAGNYASNVVALSAGVGAIDCSLGNYFTTSVTTGTLTFSFTNVPASRAFSVTVEVNHTAGTIAFPGSVVFPNSGTAPTLTAGKRHLLGFVTSNGGTTWRLVSSTNYNS